VLHYTGMRDGPTAVDWLCSPQSQVSSHYVVTEDGTVLQLVDEEARAWHAGRSCWAGVTDMNSASIGIEIVNGGHDFALPAFPAIQVASVIALCRDIMGRRGIKPERVLAHSDIAPSRKRDPGERFPWEMLHRAGVGHWVPPEPDRTGRVLSAGDSGREVEALQEALARYGYAIPCTGAFDLETETVVRAFQRHFRPVRVDGHADPGTRATLAALLGALADQRRS
jgi:N-acetylmuramoyl-L-alanine amidase